MSDNNKLLELVVKKYDELSKKKKEVASYIKQYTSALDSLTKRSIEIEASILEIQNILDSYSNLTQESSDDTESKDTQRSDTDKREDSKNSN